MRGSWIQGLLVLTNRTYTITKGSLHILASGALDAATLSFPSSGSSLVVDLEISAIGTTITASLNGAIVKSVSDSGYCAVLGRGWHHRLFTRILVDQGNRLLAQLCSVLNVYTSGLSFLPTSPLSLSTSFWLGLILIPD